MWFHGYDPFYRDRRCCEVSPEAAKREFCHISRPLAPDLFVCPIFLSVSSIPMPSREQSGLVSSKQGALPPLRPAERGVQGYLFQPLLFCTLSDFALTRSPHSAF